MMNFVFGFEVISANSLHLANSDGPTNQVFYFSWYFVLEKIGGSWTGYASLHLRVYDIMLVIVSLEGLEVHEISSSCKQLGIPLVRS